MADACEQCGSTRFLLDNGLRYCSNGHEQAGGQQVAEDSDEFGTQGKRTKRKKEKRKLKTSRIYRGPRAYKLFLQAYQHVIWKQCYALVHQKGLPAELWTVVRDLWILRLAKQAEKLENPSTVDLEGRSMSTKAGSGEETETDTQNESQASGKKASDAPLLVETVALCYLGILLMRLPTSIGDIYRWIRTEEIPYFRAMRHVPPAMIIHLPSEYQRALDTETILTPDGLQTAIYRLCALYTTEFGMSLPALNSPHLLFQYIKHLALPLEIYSVVKNLNKIVNFGFKYSLASDSRIRRNATSHPEAQLMALVVVATKLIFPFDSDTVKRYPRSLNEPAAQRMSWKKWVEIRKQSAIGANASSIDADEGTTKSRPPLQKGKEVEVTDADIFNMSNADLDHYMDWYQRTWIKPSNDAEDNNPQNEIQNMFPLKPLTAEDPDRDPEQDLEEARLEVVRQVHAAMKMNRVVSDEDAEQLQAESQTPVEVKRPGERYRLYLRVEDLPETARAFYDAAAEAGCMSVEGLVRAVRQTETRIEAWQRERRRAERFREDGGGDGDGDGDGDDHGDGDEDEDEDTEITG